MHILNFDWQTYRLSTTQQMICILYFRDNGWSFSGSIVNRILPKTDDPKNLTDTKEALKKGIKMVDKFWRGN